MTKQYLPRFVELALLFFIWYTCGSLANVYCKLYLQNVFSPLNLTLAQYFTGTIVLCFMIIATSLYSKWNGEVKEEIISDGGDVPLFSRTIDPTIKWHDEFVPELSVRQWQFFLFVGAVNGVGHLMTNSSMGAVAVSFTHTVKAGEPLFSIFLAYFVLQSRVTTTMVVSLIPIVVGVGIATTTEISFTLFGFVTAMTSNALFSTRNTLSKKLQNQSKIGSMQMFLWLSLMGFALLLPFFFLRSVFEYMEIGVRPLEPHDTAALVNLVHASLYHCLYNFVSFAILARMSPVGHAIGNAMRRLFIIMTAVMWFRNPITATNVIGTFISCVGVGLYSVAARRAAGPQRIAEPADIEMVTLPDSITTSPRRFNV